MSISHTLARYLSAAAVACSIMVAAAPAQAGVIAIFDPAFGTAIPNLGFRGTVTLDVTPACYTLGPGLQPTGGACQITAQSAQVDFYNATANPNTVLSSVSLAGTFFAPNYVLDAFFDPATGQLAGFDTVDSNIFNVSVRDANRLAPIAYDGSMVLFFRTGLVGEVQGGAYLRNCSEVEGNACTGAISNPARLTFITVPEPDSVALALLGLVTLAVTRRRAPRARRTPRRGTPSK